MPQLSGAVVTASRCLDLRRGLRPLSVVALFSVAAGAALVERLEVLGEVAGLFSLTAVLGGSRAWAV